MPNLIPTQSYAELVRVIEETHLLCSITYMKIQPGEPRLRLLIDGIPVEGLVFSNGFEESPHLVREWLADYASAQRQTFEEALELIQVIDNFASAEVGS